MSRAMGLLSQKSTLIDMLWRKFQLYLEQAWRKSKQIPMNLRYVELVKLIVRLLDSKVFQPCSCKTDLQGAILR